MHSRNKKLPRSTFAKGLPLAKTISSPASLKASTGQHSAVEQNVQY